MNNLLTYVENLKVNLDPYFLLNLYGSLLYLENITS